MTRQRNTGGQPPARTATTPKRIQKAGYPADWRAGEALGERGGCARSIDSGSAAVPAVVSIGADSRWNARSRPVTSKMRRTCGWTSTKVTATPQRASRLRSRTSIPSPLESRYDTLDRSRTTGRSVGKAMISSRSSGTRLMSISPLQHRCVTGGPSPCEDVATVVRRLMPHRLVRTKRRRLRRPDASSRCSSRSGQRRSRRYFRLAELTPRLRLAVASYLLVHSVMVSVWSPEVVGTVTSFPRLVSTTWKLCTRRPSSTTTAGCTPAGRV
jgi:hypothetical protein